MTDKIEVKRVHRNAASDWYRDCMDQEHIACEIERGENDNMLVQAFARFERDILATRTDATPVAWMPIDSAPTDWDDVVVYSPDHAGFNCGGVFLAFCDPDDDIWYAHGPSGNIRLHPTHWQPLPAGPDATNPHPPATDVAALVKALREAREALHFHYTEWDGEPEDAVPLQLARAKCDAALAPFTKGQNDE